MELFGMPLNHFLGPLMALGPLKLAMIAGAALLLVEHNLKKETKLARLEVEAEDQRDPS